MAKKSAAKKPKNAAGVNKSEAIRSFAKENPSAGPTAVAQALEKKGVEVSAAFVSTVLSNDKRKGGAPGRKRGRPRSTAAGTAVNGGVSDEAIKALSNAKKLVEQTGSVAAAKSALDAYSKLVS